MVSILASSITQAIVIEASVIVSKALLIAKMVENCKFNR